MKIKLICASGKCREIDLPRGLIRVEIQLDYEPMGPITHEWDDAKEELIELSREGDRPTS